MGTGKNNLWTLRRVLNFGNVALHTIPLLKPIVGHQLVDWKHGFYFSQVHINIPSIYTLYNACNNILFFINESIVDQTSFGFANPLSNYLLSGLCSNPSEITRSNLDFYNIIQLEGRFAFSSRVQ